jgi:diguanylate cyclase (GGDEF)-like protein/PAS domain S-box-containing protein
MQKQLINEKHKSNNISKKTDTKAGHPPKIERRQNLDIFEHDVLIIDKTIYENKIKEKTLAEIALNSISDAVICTDIDCNIDYLNIAAEKITGWSREEAHGKPINQVFNIIHSTTRKPAFSPIGLVLQTDKPRVLAADTLLIKRDGTEIAIEDSTSPIHNWDGQLTGVVIVFHDVSAAKAMAAKIEHSAHHDFLTNLPNRLLLNDRIAQAISLANRHHTQLAVLYLDLDNFKHINDSLGHSTGDKLLQSVTKRLKECVRDSDTVSRQGGDEFVILLAETKNNEAAALSAQKILDSLQAMHTIGKSQLHITTSIGISVYPADGLEAETLLKSADTAMYYAKEKGRNNYQFFIAEMNTKAVERLIIESNLKLALEKQQFILYYQPKVNLNTGQMTGAEALLRWQHDKWGEVVPNIFVPVAEDSGLIVPIGHWVLQQACTQAKIWQDAGLPEITIAINISAQEFLQKDFVASVRAVLVETGLEARFLELEITESVLMRDAEFSRAILMQLKKMGIKLAVDDFGTGYSSLSYLQRFPIDVLKIDQSFVQNIESANDDGIIVSAIISMGNSLKLKVVAEGVETPSQLAFLKARRCEEGQGYFFSHPLTAEKFAASLLKTSPSIAEVN